MTDSPVAQDIRAALIAESHRLFAESQRLAGEGERGPMHNRLMRQYKGAAKGLTWYAAFPDDVLLALWWRLP